MEVRVGSKRCLGLPALDMTSSSSHIDAEQRGGIRLGRCCLYSPRHRCEQSSRHYHSIGRWFHIIRGMLKALLGRPNTLCVCKISPVNDNILSRSVDFLVGVEEKMYAKTLERLRALYPIQFRFSYKNWSNKSAAYLCVLCTLLLESLKDTKIYICIYYIEYIAMSIGRIFILFDSF